MKSHPIGAAHPVMGDLADDRLHEPVLASFGRTRVAVEGEDLLLDEFCQSLLQRLHRLVAQRGECLGPERLSQDCGVGDERPGA